MPKPAPQIPSARRQNPQTSWSDRESSAQTTASHRRSGTCSHNQCNTKCRSYVFQRVRAKRRRLYLPKVWNSFARAGCISIGGWHTDLCQAQSPGFAPYLSRQPSWQGESEAHDETTFSAGIGCPEPVLSGRLWRASCDDHQPCHTHEDHGDSPAGNLDTTADTYTRPGSLSSEFSSALSAHYLSSRTEPNQPMLHAAR